MPNKNLASQEPWPLAKNLRFAQNLGLPAKICFVSIDVEHDNKKETKEFEGVEKLDAILDLFEKYGVRATLFVTGEVLEKYRDKFKDLATSYEIASHGFSHRFWNTLSSRERERDIIDFQNLYQQIFQKPVLGFRAPSHVIDKEGIGLLTEKGFLYDSSIVPHYPPFKKYRGYKGKAPLRPYDNGILEIPVAGQFLGIPLAGAWISKLPVFLYRVLFFFRKPSFITLSMHSWESLDSKFLGKLDGILKVLKKNKYQFLNGEQILKNRRS